MLCYLVFDRCIWLHPFSPCHPFIWFSGFCNWNCIYQGHTWSRLKVSAWGPNGHFAEGIFSHPLLSSAGIWGSKFPDTNWVTWFCNWNYGNELSVRNCWWNRVNDGLDLNFFILGCILAKAGCSYSLGKSECGPKHANDRCGSTLEKQALSHEQDDTCCVVV